MTAAASRLSVLLLRLVIRAYQLTLSPLLGPRCRFAPSCSEYAAEAIGRHGALSGGWLAVKRIARCHPWGGEGYDPVPETLTAAPAVHSSSGADLTFATPVAAALRSECQIQSSTRNPIFSSGPLIPTFARLPDETGCECWNRTTSCSSTPAAPPSP